MNRIRLMMCLSIAVALAPEVWAEPMPAPSRTPEEPAAAATLEPAAQAAPAAAEMAAKSAAPGKITLELKNVDIIQVLKLLSRKGNINIVAGPNVRGRVTLFLENVGVWDALRIIFETNDLAYIKDENILKVITGKEFEQIYGRKFDDKRVLKVIPIQHADANDIANTIKQTKNIGAAITVDERTNSLVVLELADQMPRVEEAVAKLDVAIATKSFTLQFSAPKTVEDAVKKLLTKKGTINTDSVSGKVIVSDYAYNIQKISQLIAELDSTPSVQTKVFDLHYAKYDDVEGKLKEIVSKDIGMIRSDQRTNKIVVTDVPEKIRKIEQLIAAYDEKSREVLIEAKILDVALSDEYRFGIDWDVIFQELLFQGKDFKLNMGSAFEQITQQANTNTLFFRRATATPGMRVMGTGKISSSVPTFDAVLDALKKIGDAKILSNPRVTAISGQEAIFKVITRQAFVTDTVVQNPAAATTAENVTFIDVGVNLKITPVINPDHYITLKIKPEISAVSETITTSRGNTIPIVSSQELETIVMVKDGITLILGGLIQDKTVNSSSRVPVLGNMPMFGQFFRKDYNKVTKSELVFFLTPTVVTGDSDYLSTSRHSLEIMKASEEMMWKDKNDIDYPDLKKKTTKDVYPADNPKPVHDGSAMVSPLHSSPPKPNGQFIFPEDQTPAGTEK